MGAMQELAKAVGEMRSLPGLALLPARGGVHRWQRVGPKQSQPGLPLFPERQIGPAPAPTPEPLGESLRLRVVKEGFIPASKLTIDSPKDMGELFHWLNRADREKMYAAQVDKDGKLLNVSLVGIGQMSVLPIAARELFKAAVMTPGCTGIWLVHNHPAGVTEVSGDDTAMMATSRRNALEVGIEIKGHVIVGENGWSNVESVGETPYEQPSAPTAQVPIVAMEMKLGQHNDVRITSPAILADIMRPYFRDKAAPFVSIFTDTHNRVIMVRTSATPPTWDTGEILREMWKLNAAKVAFGSTWEWLQKPGNLTAVKRAREALAGVSRSDMVLDVIGVGDDGSDYWSQTADAVQPFMKSLAAYLESGAEVLEKAVPVKMREPEGNEAGKGNAHANNTTPQAGKPAPLVQPTTPPHSRRSWETLLYWIDKTGSKNIRLQDVRYYATDGEIGQLINTLKQQHQNETRLKEFQAASQGQIGGEVVLEERPDGGFNAHPSVFYQEDEDGAPKGKKESTEGRQGGAAPKENMKVTVPSVGPAAQSESFSRRLGSLVRTMFGGNGHERA